MGTINLGKAIFEMRKKKGITQEALANALSVTPQAVSKWENETSYPDIPLIPRIAEYFDITLDKLFDYDLKKARIKVDELIQNAYGENDEVFFRDPKAFQSAIRSAMLDHPDNEKLLLELINSYEYDYRTNGETRYLTEMYDIADRLSKESRDYAVVTDGIDIKAASLLARGKYGAAKEELETLPEPQKHDVMAIRLKGKDKYNAAALAWCAHLEKLYIADWAQSDAIFELDEGDALCKNYNLAKFFYERGAKTIELYIQSYEGGEAYIWDGMQTFHWTFYLGIARCCKKLNDASGCREAFENAYRIISSSWPGFETNKRFYLEPFNETLKKYELREYLISLM